MPARTLRLLSLGALVSVLAAGCTSSPPPSTDDGPDARVLTGHTARVLEVAWSPDGTRLATAGLDAARVWDTATGAIVHTLEADGEAQSSVAWSPDGTRLATVRFAGFNGNLGVRIWDAGTGTTIHQIDQWGAASVAWSPDGAALAVVNGENGSATVFDAATGEEVRTFTPDDGRVGALSWSPDGTKLAAGTAEGAVLIRDAATGASLHVLTAHTAGVGIVAWSPDGNRIATGAADGTVRIWDAATGDSIHAFTDIGQTQAVAWSPDGTRLAAASRDAWVWDASTGALQHTFQGHGDFTWDVAFSPDGTRLAAVGAGPSSPTFATFEYGSVIVWNPISGALIHDFTGHTDLVRDVDWSPDGTRIATAGRDDHTARIWRADGPPTATMTPHRDEKPECVPPLPESAVASQPGTPAAFAGTRVHTLDGVKIDDPSPPLAWSPDGAQLATTGRQTAQIWDATTGTPVHTLTGHTGEMTDVAWSPDGAHVATASTDNTVRIWNAAAGVTLRTLGGSSVGSEDYVEKIAWSPDGTLIATRGIRGPARVWDASTAALVHTLGPAEAPTLAVAWAPDGAQLATATPFDVTVWDIGSGAPVRVLDCDELVESLAWSPDGTRLAVGGFGTVRVWDAMTGRTVAHLTRLQAAVHQVAWSPENDRLVGFSDGIARIWDTHTWLLVHALGNPSDRIPVYGAWSPDGVRLATGHGGTAQVWDSRTGQVTHTLTGHTGWVYTLAWSPDGARLATTGNDGVAIVWR